MQMHLLQGSTEHGQLWVLIQLGAVSQATCPGKDAASPFTSVPNAITESKHARSPCNRVGAGLSSLLVHAVVAGDCAMSSLCLHSLAVRAHQHASHQTQRPKALWEEVQSVKATHALLAPCHTHLCQRVGLHIAIVVLARPHEAAL